MQGGSWLAFGRGSLAETVGRDILGLTKGYFFLDGESLLDVPLRAQAPLRGTLLTHPHVSEEAELPASNRHEVGRNGAGTPIYEYETPWFGIRSWQSSPLGARVEFAIVRTPLAANGFQVRYYWVMGFWVRRESQNPIWVSWLYNNTLKLSAESVTAHACAWSAPAWSAA